MKTYKRFPIYTDTACQLKWSHSTVFLTELTTSSCHRVKHDKFDLETFDFHNTKEKLRDRELMLEGKWPGRGCEHCKNIEDAGGTSDRMLHLDFHGYRAPPELATDLTATQVTPRILEIYFSNVCNLKCIYCTPNFSSQIKQENLKSGNFYKNGVHIPQHTIMPDQYPEATDKMFAWLDDNISTLDQLLVLGGEPFIQKETDRLFDLLESKGQLDLNLVIFSNLTIGSDRFDTIVEKLKQLPVTQVTVVCSIDSWGPGAAYHRGGLDQSVFERNILHLLNNTNFTVNVNSTLTVLSIPEMPALVEKINQWGSIRDINWTMMKVSGKPYLHPTALGSEVFELGFKQSVDAYRVSTPEQIAYVEYFKGIGAEIAQSKRNDKLAEQLKIYLTELDRRRGTNYTDAFPEIAKLL